MGQDDLLVILPLNIPYSSISLDPKDCIFPDNKI